MFREYHVMARLHPHDDNPVVVGRYGMSSAAWDACTTLMRIAEELGTTCRYFVMPVYVNDWSNP